MVTLIEKLYSIRLGVQGENIAQPVEIDMTSWAEAFPGATFHILFRRYNETTPYPVVSDYEAPILTWTPTATDTAVIGVGYTEVRAIDPETGLVKKSRIIPTSVENSVTGNDSEYIPEPMENWVNRVLAARNDAVSAAAYAALVSQGGETSFEIDDNGDFIYTCSDGTTEVVINLGPVTSYGLAKSMGFSGTEEEWVQKLINSATASALNTLDGRVTTINTKVTNLTTQVSTLSAEVDTDVSTLTTEVNKKINTTTAQAQFTPKPETDGDQGDALRNNGDGTTSWAPLGLPTDEQTATAVSDWLDDHPEATTTVEDGAITEAKLAEGLAGKVAKIEVNEQNLADLVSAVEFQHNSVQTTWVEGTLDDEGAEQTSDRSFRSGYIDLHGRNLAILVPPDESVSTLIYFYSYDSESEQYVYGTRGQWNSTSRVTTNGSYQYCRLLLRYASTSTTRDEQLKGKVHMFTAGPDNYRGKIGLMDVTAFGSCTDEGYYSFTGNDLSKITDKPAGISTGGILFVYKHISDFTLYQVIYDLNGSKYIRKNVNDAFTKVTPEVDGTLSVEGVAADAYAAGKAVARLYDAMNLIDNSVAVTWTEGTLDGSGAEQTSERSFRSGYIDLHNMNLTIIVPSDGSVSTRVYFYNYDSENEQYVYGTRGNWNATSRVTTNSEYQYCRILTYYTSSSVPRDDTLKRLVHVRCGMTDSYMGKIGLMDVTSFGECSNEGYYSFLQADLSKITDKPASLTTGGVLITRKHFASFSLYQEIYDLYKNKYVRHRPDQDFVKVHDTVSDDNHYFVHTCVDKPIDLSGKGLFIFGDSITTHTHGGFTWGSIVAAKTGCTEYNYGVGGYSFVNGDKQVSRIIDEINGVPAGDWSHCDVCIVAAGTNDVGKGTTPSQLKVGVKDVIDTLKIKAPDAKIIFITPIQRGTDYGDSYMKNNELPWIAGVICNVALANGCSVINGFDCPIPYETNDIVTTLTEDGTHPNAVGKRVYAQFVLNALL